MLRISPCMPDDWDTYAVRYRFGDTLYRIKVLRGPPEGGPAGIRTALDGIDLGDAGIPLADDHHEHFVEVTLPATR